MGAEQDNTYYDQQWTGDKWRKNWNEISKVRTRMYEQAALMVPQQSPLVIDLGCGGGHFGQALKVTNPPETYIGYDFSEAAIFKAKQKLGQGGQFQFFQADLRYMELKKSIPAGGCFVCLEVLEHLKDDMRIFSLIPEGSQVVISVPTFDEPSHVRHFTDFDKVLGRYRQFLDPKTIKHKAIWQWFLFTAKRKNSNEEQKAKTVTNGQIR